jgi:hypothetical protein
MQPGFGGALRDPECHSDVGERSAVEMVEHEERALAGSEPVEGSLENIKIGGMIVELLRGLR